MNVLIIDLHCDARMPSGANEFGGGNTYSRGLLQGICNNSNIFCLYVTRKKYEELPFHEKLSETCHIERITLGDNSINDKDYLQYYIDEAIVKISQLIDKYKLKNFIIHSSYWQSGLVAIPLSEKHNTHFIHTIQSNGKKKQIVNSKQKGLDFRVESEQLIFEKAKYLICSSEAEQNEIHNLYNIDYQKLILTGLPVAPEFSNPTHNKHGDISLYSINRKDLSNYVATDYKFDHMKSWWINGPFLFYGRLHVDKGICEIIQAWINLNKKYKQLTPPLWIVGGTIAQIDELHKILENMGIMLDVYENDHQVIWWGTLSPADLSCLLTKSMVLVTHSKYESGGLMVLESLACSTPVIATPYGYAKDFIYDWYNGFLIDYNDIKSLEFRMSHFIENPYLSDLLSKNAKKTYNYISEKCDFIQLHLDLYADNYSQIKRCKSDMPIITNHILGYQNTMNNKMLCALIEEVFGTSSYLLVDEYYSSDSAVKIFEADKVIYRIDMWLTTFNIKRLWSKPEKYIHTSTEKIMNIARFQEYDGFKSLEYYSIDNKLSIIAYNSKKPKTEIASILNLVDKVFNYFCEDLIKEPCLDNQINDTLNIADMCINYIANKETTEKIYQELCLLKKLNAKRKKLSLGLTPYILSSENIICGQLYGIYRYSLSEYGHALALALIAFNISPDNVLSFVKDHFDNTQTLSIISWYIYLILSNELHNALYLSNQNNLKDLSTLFDFLK